MGERLSSNVIRFSEHQYSIEGNTVLKTEVYNYQRPRELVSSNSFSVEHAPVVTDQELRDEIISYLGEFRFDLQKYDYQLVFSHTDDEGWKLRDPYRLEAMGIKADRSVEERRMRRESTNREEAEGEGIISLEKQLEKAQEGDIIVWASPPGSQEEGYGDYGFFFVGQVKRSIQARKDISMTAIRVENPTIARFNLAFKNLSGEPLSFFMAEGFLRNPVVVDGPLSEAFIDATLGEIFQGGQDSLQRERFKIAMQKMEPRINQFIALSKWGTKEEKKKAFHALENYALKLRRDLQTEAVIIYEHSEKFDMFVQNFGHEPPKVKGSCPIKSSNPLNQGFSTLNSVLEGLFDKKWFNCPKCLYKADGPVGNTCPGCGLTKEDYAQESGNICE